MNRQYLLESPSGVMWNIYIDEDMNLVYSKKQDSTWSGASSLDKLTVKSFSATVDIEDKVHIVVYTTTKQLIYYQWDGGQWLYSIMTTLRSRFQDIPFAKIFSDGGNVHILYYIESTLYRNRDTLYHYYGDGFNWEGGKAFSFPSEDNISIDSLYWYDRSNIFLYYSRRENRNTLVHRSTFEKKGAMWSDSVPIFNIPMVLEDIQICLDDKSNEHLIGTHAEEGKYTLYYASHDREHMAIDSQPKPFKSPFITILNKDIYVTWNVDDIIFSSILNRERKDFNRLRETIRNGMSLVDHITLHSDGISHIKTSWRDIFTQNDIDDLRSYHHPQSNEIEVLQKDISSMKNQISNFEAQLDDLYSLFYTLKDYTAQYDKSLYNIQVSLTKQANDIAQIKNRPTQNKYQAPPNYSVPYEDNDTDIADSDEEVVSLGDTKIIISNEEYKTDDS